MPPPTMRFTTVTFIVVIVLVLHTEHHSVMVSQAVLEVGTTFVSMDHGQEPHY